MNTASTADQPTNTAARIPTARTGVSFDSALLEYICQVVTVPAKIPPLTTGTAPGQSCESSAGPVLSPQSGVTGGPLSRAGLSLAYCHVENT